MKYIMMFTTLFLMTSFEVYGASYITIKSRCNENNLGPEEAHGRNAWAAKCFPQDASEITKRDTSSPVEYALVSDEAETNWSAPLNPAESCSGWAGIKAFCLASCYTPNQEVLFDDGYLRIDQALESLKTNVVTLSKFAKLDELSYDILPVESYTKSWRASSEMVRRLSTESGGSLEVTLNHPVLISDGVMVQAKDLKVGDQLVKQDGTFDSIVKMDDHFFFGFVYNLAPDSLHPLENVVVAQGYLNGSANYQYHELFKDLMYRKMLRTKINLAK